MIIIANIIIKLAEACNGIISDNCPQQESAQSSKFNYLKAPNYMI